MVAVAAIVLAAGLSRRMAPRNKLLLRHTSGVPMIARTVDAVLASRARPVLVVTGHQASDVAAALADRRARIVHAARYADGLSASLRAGLAALPASVAAVLICLGDMPLVRAVDIDRLIDAYEPAAGALIVVPVHAGRRGNPVLWDRSFFAAMSALTGDTGARALLREYSDCIIEIAASCDGVLRDFDTIED